MKKLQKMHCKCQCHFSIKIAFIQQDDEDAWWSSESKKHSCNLHQNWMYRSEHLSAL